MTHNYYSDSCKSSVHLNDSVIKMGVSGIKTPTEGWGAWPQLAALLLLVGGCDSVPDSESHGPAAVAPPGRPAAAEGPRRAANVLRNAYFGDLHIHTRYSLDAFTFGVRATPDDAYRYAKGGAILHPLGYSIRLRNGPLDFLAVTDHAEYIGLMSALADPDGPLATQPLAKKAQSTDLNENRAALAAIVAAIRSGQPIADLDAKDVVGATWKRTIEAAERHNDPGTFTTFIAYEYSSSPDGANLHRNIIFSGNRVPETLFSAVDSRNPEDLWTWLDQQRAQGFESLAIPHNSNWSQGKMFERTNWAGKPIDAAYAEQRLRNEPLVELTQVKGTSETHPLLSPNDEWAGFEIWKMSKAGIDQQGNATLSEGATTGAYARDALRAGLEMEPTIGKNPYRFGFIGSSDGHDAASPVDEDAYFGKLGVMDGSPELRGSVRSEKQDSKAAAAAIESLEWGASGLAGVWAEENTRESIYAALRRKETFATSGPRIRLRFFAGYDYPTTFNQDRDAIAKAYAGGVPMGAELLAHGATAPRFFVWALRDPREPRLHRAQVVKGWVEDGKSKEQVFDVACSDGLNPDSKTHRCPDNGATVDLGDCKPSPDMGAVELKAVWSDPTFDPSQPAFYYARVLQNPSCRWSTWDAVRAGVKPNPKAPATIQERAWSSPIWYVPET